jgi:hypothetical protein
VNAGNADNPSSPLKGEGRALARNFMAGMNAIEPVNGGRQLSAEELAEVAKLVARDHQVRGHEAAHLAAAGPMATTVEYTYEMGPDGKIYAVGGKVKLTVSPGQTPEETLAIARQVRAAAQAPADPSGQDVLVAAEAGEMEADAVRQIAAERTSASRPSQRSSDGFDHAV